MFTQSRIYGNHVDKMWITKKWPSFFSSNSTIFHQDMVPLPEIITLQYELLKYTKNCFHKRHSTVSKFTYSLLHKLNDIVNTYFQKYILPQQTCCKKPHHCPLHFQLLMMHIWRLMDCHLFSIFSAVAGCIWFTVSNANEIGRANAEWTPGNTAMMGKYIGSFCLSAMSQTDNLPNCSVFLFLTSMWPPGRLWNVGKFSWSHHDQSEHESNEALDTSQSS